MMRSFSPLRSAWPLAVLSPLLLAAAGALFAEGMWLPPTVASGAMYEALVAQGLEVQPGELWRNDGPSLGDAMVMVGQNADDVAGGIQGFGSASFVSGEGLILTNHHVAFDAITGLSTRDRNHVVEGFVAATRDDERSCPSLAVQITRRITDVTAQVLDGVPEGVPESERQAAIAERIAALLEQTRSEGASDACDIKEMRLGTRYDLFEFDVIRDVRMVYAPPQMIGEFGGDIDNWIWPRHTGDFTYLRAYVSPDGEGVPYAEDNVPYQPDRFLEVSLAGYEPGDFCFIMGHPGQTWRYRTSYSVHFWETRNFPQQVAALEAGLEQLEAQAAEGEEAAIRVAPTIKQLSNALKNFQGQIDGLAALHVVERRRAQEQELIDWIAAEPARQERYGHIFPTLEKLYDELASASPREQRAFGDRITPLRRELIEALAEFRGEPLYSDANMTLRFTNGVVRGYSPREAVHYDYFTTLRGVMEKHTGEAPFDVPAAERKLIAAADWGRYADPKMGSVPACFLTDTDITGGNSGSPIMNARGQLIGLAFDGNIESVTSDFMFEDHITRTINVDIRYVLWCTEKLAGLQRLIAEMKIAES